jgi:nitroreductase
MNGGGVIKMSDIMRVIQSRASSRMPFDMGRPVPAHDLEQILEAGRWAPTAHNMQNFEIVVVDDPAVLAALGRVSSPVSMEFVRENYAQLSFSEAELRQKKVGILATRFPPAWRSPAATATEIAAATRPLPVSPTMLFLTYNPGRRAPASEGDFLGAISLGCVTENMWLMASSLGIGFHIVSSFGARGVESEVKRILAVPEPLRIVFAIRLGYPAGVAGSDLRVRREPRDFTHRNRFGRCDPA